MQNLYQIHFDQEDHRITDALRDRIEGWANVVPDSQFQQYGPLNLYFCQKFPKALVKPQALVRPELGEADEKLLETHLAGKTAKLTKEEKARAKTLAEDLLNGLYCKDSTSKNYVLNAKNSGRTYPDFHICTFGGASREDGTGQDIVRIVVEIGSIPRNGDLQKAKDELWKQLKKSVAMLGDEGGRWQRDMLGVAIIGTEVAVIEWEDKELRQHEMQWFSMYDDQWAQLMEKFVDKF